MIKFEKNKRYVVKQPIWSILVPSWNNLAYLQLCIQSLRQYTTQSYQIIVIVNEGRDGTLEWVKQQSDLDYIYSAENIGICYALNACRSLISGSYVVYANDDMYFLPEWDRYIWEEIQQIGHPYFMLSGTLIEPYGHNPCVVIADFGHTTDDFREQDLLAQQKNLQRNDW